MKTKVFWMRKSINGLIDCDRSYHLFRYETMAPWVRLHDLQKKSHLSQPSMWQIKTMWSNFVFICAFEHGTGWGTNSTGWHVGHITPGGLFGTFGGCGAACAHGATALLVVAWRRKSRHFWQQRVAIQEAEATTGRRGGSRERWGGNCYGAVEQNLEGSMIWLVGNAHNIQMWIERQWT